MGILMNVDVRSKFGVNKVWRTTVAMTIFGAIAFSIPAQARIIPTKSGTSCSTVGATSTVKKVSYVCVTVGKKKVWRKTSTSSVITTTVTTTTTVPTTNECVVRSTASGVASGANESMPGGNQVRAAVSSDGINWTRLSASILDQIGTPSLVINSKGLPLLYTTAHKINGSQDGFAVSIGTADGRTWRHCSVNLKGFPSGLLGVDPDVVALSGGGLRMYLTGSATAGSSRIAIHYADSTDGVTWTYGGLAFESSDSILDSVTFKVQDTWHMYALTGTSTEMSHGVSSDGRTFTYVGKGPVLLDGKAVVLSQAIVIGGQLRIFCFAPPGSWIRSLITADGTTFRADSQLALVFDSSIERKFIRDPAVVQLANGTYFMAYATPIP